MANIKLIMTPIFPRSCSLGAAWSRLSYFRENARPLGPEVRVRARLDPGALAGPQSCICSQRALTAQLSAQ